MRGPETAFTSGENGHKIAFDPRDLSETHERSKQPKLTMMEEVLLLGLKDKQVRSIWCCSRNVWHMCNEDGHGMGSLSRKLTIVLGLFVLLE